MFARTMRCAGLWTALAALVLCVGSAAMAADVTLEVAAGDADRIETPVCAELDAAQALKGVALDGDLSVSVSGQGGTLPGQLEALPGGKARLWFVVPQLKAGQKATFRAKIEQRKPAEAKSFVFQDTAGDHLDLLFAGRKVTRLMYVFNNDPNVSKRFPTSKPFTHVFNAVGEKVITSPGGQPFPHHRGIFIGWNRTTTADGKRYDFWHTRNVWLRLEKFTGKQAGPVFGRMVARIRWEDPKGEPVVLEDRAITVYRQAKPELLLDFVSTLHSARGDIQLIGDPEHAGCQFRAHFEVGQRYKKMKGPEIKAQGLDTRYVHPPGAKPGKKGTKDMPWSSVSFALWGSRFNVGHLNHPGNPKGTLYSAYRPYGRFGAYAKAELKADQPLTVRYRYFVREGQKAALTVAEMQRLHADFATPPQVTVK